MYPCRLSSALAMAALAAILLPTFLTAQITFERTYGDTADQSGQSVKQTSDWGYVIAGGATSPGAGNGDAYLIRTGERGETLWAKTYGGAAGDVAACVVQTVDGGYVLAGTTNSYGAGDEDVYLVKTDAAGSIQWTKTYGSTGSDGGLSVLQASDSGYSVAGYSVPRTQNNSDVYLIRTDAAGDTLWTRKQGGASGDVAYCLQLTADGGFVMAGYTESSGSDGDVLLYKVDSYGNTMFWRTYGGVHQDVAWSVCQTRDRGYVVVGSTRSYGAGVEDVYMIRTDASGDILWTRTYGGAGSDIGYSVQETSDSGFVIAGSTSSDSSRYIDLYLIKTDANGDTLWTRSYGGPNHDEGRSVRQTADHGYIIAGWTSSFGAGGYDVYLIKTDSLGNVAVAEPKTSPARSQGLTITCEPNPTTGRTTISFKPQASSSKPLALRVFDAQGRLVHSSLGIRTSSFWLDLGSMPAGAYFLRLDAGSDRATTRLVVQR